MKKVMIFLYDFCWFTAELQEIDFSHSVMPAFTLPSNSPFSSSGKKAAATPSNTLSSEGLNEAIKELNEQLKVI